MLRAVTSGLTIRILGSTAGRLTGLTAPGIMKGDITGGGGTMLNIKNKVDNEFRKTAKKGETERKRKESIQGEEQYLCDAACMSMV